MLPVINSIQRSLVPDRIAPPGGADSFMRTATRPDTPMVMEWEVQRKRRYA